MTSTNSLNSNRFLPMFKNVFKRYAAFFIIAQVLSALYAFFVPRLNLSSIAEVAEYMEAGYKSDLTASSVWSMSFFLFAAGSLWMFILAVSLFNEIYSKRASAFYFSMPVKRGTYFNVNLLYGIVTVVTSYVLVTALSVISIKTNKICPPEFYTFDPAQLAKVLLVALLSVIASWAVYMLFAVLSGRKWHYIVLSLVVSNSLYGIVTNIISYTNNSVWGLSIPHDYNWIVSPSAAFLESLESESILKFVIVLIIQFVLAYSIGYTVFKKRKAEIAEVTVAGNIVPTVIFVICLLSAGLSGLTMADGGPVYASFAAAAVVTVVASIIITAIFRKKVFTKKSVKCLAGTLIAVLIFALAVEFLPNIKYKNYVPAADEVESVVFDENVQLTENEGIFFSLFNSMFSAFDDYSFGNHNTTYNFTGEEAKAKVEALHKKMIGQTAIDNHYSEDYFYHGGYCVKLTYTLKNGKTVKRYYDVCTNDIYDEYIALMQTEEALRQTPQLNLKDEDILFVGVVDYRFEDESDLEYYDADFFEPSEYHVLDEYGTLIDNVVKDKMNEPRDVFEALDQNDAFSVYDPDNHYRDQDDSDFNFGALMNGEYNDFFWDYEEEDDGYYPDYHDITITVYGFYDDVTDEMKEKLSGMSPEELLDYEVEYEITGHGYLISESYINLNIEADTNTVEYLKSLGLIQ